MTFESWGLDELALTERCRISTRVRCEVGWVSAREVMQRAVREMGGHDGRVGGGAAFGGWARGDGDKRRGTAVVVSEMGLSGC